MLLGITFTTVVWHFGESTTKSRHIVTNIPDKRRLHRIVSGNPTKCWTLHIFQFFSRAWPLFPFITIFITPIIIFSIFLMPSITYFLASSTAIPLTTIIPSTIILKSRPISRRWSSSASTRVLIFGSYLSPRRWPIRGSPSWTRLLRCRVHSHYPSLQTIFIFIFFYDSEGDKIGHCARAFYPTLGWTLLPKLCPLKGVSFVRSREFPPFGRNFISLAIVYASHIRNKMLRLIFAVVEPQNWIYRSH